MIYMPVTYSLEKRVVSALIPKDDKAFYAWYTSIGGLPNFGLAKDILREKQRRLKRTYSRQH